MGQSESPIEFPCRFPIKAIGPAEDDFVEHVRELILRHVPELPAGEIRTRDSAGGKFIAVTAVIEARSREQLDAVYRELTASSRIKFVL